MTDVFFSYSSKDRERVRPIRDALVSEGFDVFWDQEVPPGRNWDEWIRQHLDAARCTIVFWSEHSVRSDNVVHEATVAKNFQRLIPVLLDPIASGAFPMGHYTTQGLQFFAAEGGATPDLRRLVEEVEAKATRRWMRRRFAELEGRVKALNAQREQMEDNEAALHRRIAQLESELEIGRRERAKLQSALMPQSSAETRIKELEAALASYKSKDAPKNISNNSQTQSEQDMPDFLQNTKHKKTNKNSIFYRPRLLILTYLMASLSFFITSSQIDANGYASPLSAYLAFFMGLYHLLSTTLIGIRIKDYAIALYGFLAPLISGSLLFGVAYIVYNTPGMPSQQAQFLLGFFCLFLSVSFYIGLQRYAAFLYAPKIETLISSENTTAIKPRGLELS